ncbi:hypothetical protein KR018_005414 [Drosophila ironensis]|nr:hypothetical protein KR018_005414 [Drosophila ironensis]
MPRVDNSRGQWYISTIFLLFWLLIFTAVVIPLFHSVPNAKTIEESPKGAFIAQRAMGTLSELAKIGPKVVGSFNNENRTVEFLLNELEQIKEHVLDEYFDIEIDHQVVSGSYIHRTMVNMYQGVQNLVIKLSPKNCTSETYLLVNSHFDSKPTSPSAGDAGQMVAIILEVLRVMSTTRQTFEHPIVFLLNGAEENPLQASHGFITQHKWANNCKVFLNLKGYAGEGRELLLKTGTSQNWLIDYYKKSVEHPFATTAAEELFQKTDFLASETDFEILSKFGNLTGLELAQIINGYTYQTKFDIYGMVSAKSVQSVGDNVLGLVRAVSNATELQDTAVSNSVLWASVFFDFLGLFVISYSFGSGVTLNTFVAIITIVLIFMSLKKVASISNVSVMVTTCLFLMLTIVQSIAVLLGVGMPILVSNAFNGPEQSLAYFSTPVLMFGLYVCPSLCGLFLPSYIVMSVGRGNKVSFARVLKMILHGHAFILAIVTIVLSFSGLRSTYVITWVLIFYDCHLVLNLLFNLTDRQFSWTGPLIIFQLISFLFVTYLQYTLIETVTPIMGRVNRCDLYANHANICILICIDYRFIYADRVIAIINALGTVLAMGFLIPLVNMFRKPSMVLVFLMATTGICIFLATCTPLGFPYSPPSSVKRVAYLHVRRTFYDYNGLIAQDDSGYLFKFQDNRGPAPLEKDSVNLTGLVGISDDCGNNMMCGFPLFDHGWVQDRWDLMWLPREKLIDPPRVPKVELLSKKVLPDNQTARYEFRVNVTDHTSIFIEPYLPSKITNWTFPLAYIDQKFTYHIYFSYGTDSTPLSFFIDVLTGDNDFEKVLFRMGVSGHFIGDKGDEISQQFAKSFPNYVALMEWPVSYQQLMF